MVNDATTPLVPPSDPRLGRLPEFDEASRNYQIRPILLAENITKPRSYTWSPGPMLNQGNTGTCVGHAGANDLAARPVRWPGTSNLAFVLYELACRRDIWSGNDNGDVNFGTSVLALMKVLSELGFIPEYRWAGAGSGKVLEDVVLTIGYKGPVIAGTDWLNSMFDVGANGHVIIDQSSGVGGGHAYLKNQAKVVWKSTSLPAQPTMEHIDRAKSRVGIVNSWGADWGINGTGWWTFEEEDWLLARAAESAVPVLRQRTT